MSLSYAEEDGQMVEREQKPLKLKKDKKLINPPVKPERMTVDDTSPWSRPKTVDFVEKIPSFCDITLRKSIGKLDCTDVLVYGTKRLNFTSAIAQFRVSSGLGNVECGHALVNALLAEFKSKHLAYLTLHTNSTDRSSCKLVPLQPSFTSLLSDSLLYAHGLDPTEPKNGNVREVILSKALQYLNNKLARIRTRYNATHASRQMFVGRQLVRASAVGAAKLRKKYGMPYNHALIASTEEEEKEEQENDGEKAEM